MSVWSVKTGANLSTCKWVSIRIYFYIRRAKGQTYKCRARSRGALLSLPHGGLRTDVIRTKVFEEYVRDNADSWYTWAQDNRLGVERMEDLILITGCTLVTSWAAAVFDGHNTPEDAASISLHAQKFESGGAEVFWRNRHGNVDYHNSHFNPLANDKQYLPRNQCVFIRVCRAKSTFFGTKHLQVVAEPLPSDPNNRWERTSFQNDNLRAAAEPPPDDPDDPENRRKSDIQALLQGNRVPNFPLDLKQLRVERVMDYVAKVSESLRLEDANSEGDIATAHGDDLQLIRSKDPEAFTTGAAQKFSRENKPPALIENGNVSPISLQGWEDQNSDFHSINGDEMRKRSQDNLVSQEQLEASAMKGSPSTSTIYLNESCPSTSTRSTIYLNEGYSSNGLRLSLSDAVIAENTDSIKTFVGRSQESYAITSGEPKKKKLPRPAPRQTQQDSSSATITPPPPLRPLRPSRGTPPLVPPGVDPSSTSFLDDLRHQGVGKAFIAENMDFIKALVHRPRESGAMTNGEPKKKPPPLAPRQTQQDSSSSTTTLPPSLHPLPPSRGTPPRAPPGDNPSWTAFLDDLQRHGVGEAVIAENMDFIKAFVRRSQESGAMTNGSNGKPKKKKPPPPAPRRAQQDSSSSTTTQPPSLHPLRPSRDTPPRAPPSSAEPSMQGPYIPPEDILNRFEAM